MSATKAIKVIVLTATAQEHHTSVKIKNILRWLKSGHNVNVSITGKADRQKSMEGLVKNIEREIKNGAEIKQKVIKPESISMSLRPTAQAINFKTDNDVPNQGEDLNDITAGKDLLSDDFEKELEKSISEDRSRNKKN